MELIEGALQIGVVAHIRPNLDEAAARRRDVVAVLRNVREVRVGSARTNGDNGRGNANHHTDSKLSFHCDLSNEVGESFPGR
jgi:hypothetical protein